MKLRKERGLSQMLTGRLEAKEIFFKCYYFASSIYSSFLCQQIGGEYTPCHLRNLESSGCYQ